MSHADIKHAAYVTKLEQCLREVRAIAERQPAHYGGNQGPRGVRFEYRTPCGLIVQKIDETLGEKE